MLIPEELFRQIHESMPLVCVDLVIHRAGSVLLLRRAIEPLRGQWFFPGGRIRRNETIVNAAHRIAEDEAGTLIDDLEFLAVEETLYKTSPFPHRRGTHTVNLVHAARARNGVVEHDAHHSGYKWVGIGDIETMGLSDYVVRNVRRIEKVNA